MQAMVEALRERSDMLGLSADRYQIVAMHAPSYADEFIADEVNTQMLFVDYSYARPLTQSRMRELDQRKYDHKKAGVIYVSMRNADGHFALIDGQGRLYMALRDKVAKQPARVYLDLTIEQEAELYLAFNRDRTETTAIDDFIARLRAKESKALNINDVLTACNLHVARGGNAQGSLHAISTVEYVYTQWGGEALGFVLRKLQEIWPKDNRALTSDMIGGLSALFARVPSLEKQSTRQFKFERLTDRLQAKTPKQMKALALSQKEARVGMSMHQAMGRAMLMLYDAGQQERYRMGDWPEREYSDAARANLQANAKKASSTRRKKKESGQ